MKNLKELFENFWSSIFVYLITGGILGVVVDLVLFRALEISENSAAMKFVDVAAVSTALLSQSMKNKIGEDNRFILDWVSIVAPGAILIVEVFK